MTHARLLKPVGGRVTSGEVAWLTASALLAAIFIATLDSFIGIVAGPAIQTDPHAQSPRKS